jgi:hypothetical protein
MTHSIDPSGIIGGLASAAAASPGSMKKGARRKNEAGAQVRVGRDYEAVIHKAIQSEPSDTETVQHARDALNARQLDTMEAARHAAEKLTQFGI